MLCLWEPQAESLYLVQKQCCPSIFSPSSIVSMDAEPTNRALAEPLWAEERKQTRTGERMDGFH